ncbi:hypothetical protein Tco_0898331 [Tanacetum coccineum]
MKTLMSSDTKLTKDEECESVDSTKFQGMIGSLLYLTASRPNIMFSVCLCARFQEAPKTSHLEAVKRIFRCIKGTTHLGLWYPKGTGIETVVYADSDHAGNYKQTALAISTTEVKYVSAGKACQQALSMKQALINYDIRLDDVLIMYDNLGAIDLSENLVTMPRKTADDHQNTRNYIPIISHEYTSPLKEMLRNLESRCIHEGRVVYPNFANLVYVGSMFSHIGFDCLLEINEQICPRFVLEFYSQYHIDYSEEGQMLINFVIQNNFFSYTLEEFGQILGIPYKGACVFTDKWSLDDLQYGVPTDGSYQTNPPCPDDIKNYIQEERVGPVTRIRHGAEIPVEENEILTREIVSTMKPWVEIIRENVFCLGGNRDHVPACLCYMLYCVAKSEKFNLAFFIAKRMEFVTKQARLILSYGMLLTRLFKYVMSESPELFNEFYVLYDRVMYPLAAQQERKTQKNYGTKRGYHSTSSSSAFDQPSSSHLNDDDDDDGNDKGTSRASTPSPTRFVNSLTNEVPRVFENPPNVEPDMEQFYTRQTEILNHQVQLRDEHRGGLRSIDKGFKNL